MPVYMKIIVTKYNVFCSLLGPEYKAKKVSYSTMYTYLQD